MKELVRILANVFIGVILGFLAAKLFFFLCHIVKEFVISIF